MATTTTYGLNKPTVGGDENTWGQITNDNWDDVDDLLDGTTAIKPDLDEGLWKVGGVAVTATAAELNILDGVTATASALNTASTHYVPSGGIIMWSGSVASVPSGWFLCDGTNSTPDLRNRFIVGAGDTYAVDATGGAASVTLTEAQLPAHTHSDGTLAAASAGAHQHTIPTTLGVFGSGGGVDGGPNFPYLVDSLTGSAGAHTHDVTGSTGSTGSGEAVATLPPYYALAYIMKA